MAANQDPELSALLDRFVRVRLVQMGGVDLNIYQFDRDVLVPGFNIWTAPTPKLMFTFGYTYNSYKSNANLCPPIFDG